MPRPLALFRRDRLIATTLSIVLTGLLLGHVQAQPTPAEKARSLYEEAAKAEKKKDYESAIQTMESVLKLAPKNAFYLSYTGFLETKTKQHQSGLKHIEQAIAENSKVGWYYVTAVIHAKALHKHDLVREYGRKARTFELDNLGQENLDYINWVLNLYQSREYEVRWKYDPAKGFGARGMGKGPFYLPAVTERPYQKVLSFEIRGAVRHRKLTQNGIDLLEVYTKGQQPFEIVAKVRRTWNTCLGKVVREAKPEYPKDVRLYLGTSEAIDPKSAVVRKIAVELQGPDTLSTTQNILAWLSRNLTYKIEPFEKVEEVFERKYGECGGWSAAFVSLCRASGIPAREVWGPCKAGTEFTPPGHLCGHVWAEVWLPGAGWTPVEPQQAETLGQQPVDYIRVGHFPMDSFRWPKAGKGAWINMNIMGAYRPAYTEKLLRE